MKMNKKKPSVKSVIFFIFLFLLSFLMSSELRTLSAAERSELSQEREIIEWSLVAATGVGALSLRMFDKPWVSDPLIGGESGKSYHDDTIPDYALGVGAVSLGGFILFCPNRDGFMNRTTYENVKGYSAAASFNLFFTSLTKNLFGRKRPSYDNFPEESKESRGRKSFISGHSSISFCSATYTSLYIYNYIGDSDDSVNFSLRVASAVLLHASAGFVAWSRVHDNLHHRTDVFAGALAGSGFASLAFWYFNFSSSKRKPVLQNTEIFIMPDEEGVSISLLQRF